MATLAAPALIVSSTGGADVRPLPALAGSALIATGLALFVQTVALFARAGKGTLAPWDPTSRLVVRGPYRRVRNPMISAVLSILLGETVLLGSVAMLVYAGAFFAVNALWMPLVEEPVLRERFGVDYDRYRANVPRWLPRLRPWNPG
jgi:protein-S-isoprenylcysteine O-methyltransferase Ste14